MKRKPQIDYKTYQWLLSKINQKVLFEEQSSSPKDLLFIKEGAWLADTAVIEHLTRRRGTYSINLLFAHYKQPLKLLIRTITQHSNPRKAQVMSQLFRRQAAKDQRGTLKVDESSFLIDYN